MPSYPNTQGTKKIPHLRVFDEYARAHGVEFNFQGLLVPAQKPRGRAFIAIAGLGNRRNTHATAGPSISTAPSTT